MGEESVCWTFPLGKGQRQEDPYITRDSHLSEDLRYQQQKGLR